MREHITETEFSAELSASVVDGRVELCALTSSPRTRDERRHWWQTAVVVTVVRKYPRDLSCSSPPFWPQVRELTTSVNKVVRVSERRTLRMLQKHALTTDGLELLVPAAQMCHQHRHRHDVSYMVKPWWLITQPRTVQFRWNLPLWHTVDHVIKA